MNMSLAAIPSCATALAVALSAAEAGAQQPAAQESAETGAAGSATAASGSAATAPGTPATAAAGEGGEAALQPALELLGSPLEDDRLAAVRAHIAFTDHVFLGLAALLGYGCETVETTQRGDGSSSSEKTTSDGLVVGPEVALEVAVDHVFIPIWLRLLYRPWTRTGEDTADGGFDVPVTPPVEIFIDEPFYFLVRDRLTGAPLFAGFIADPSLSP
jgi:hypothetical protein